MITLYHAERTRSVRVVWLLEELGLPYELRKVTFAPPVKGFTLVAARVLGLLGGGQPGLEAYLRRLEARPAFRRAVAT